MGKGRGIKLGRMCSRLRRLNIEESVLRRWEEYFEELMIEENEGERRVEYMEIVEQEVGNIC